MLQGNSQVPQTRMYFSETEYGTPYMSLKVYIAVVDNVNCWVGQYPTAKIC